MNLSGLWVRMIGCDRIDLATGRWNGTGHRATFWRLYRNDKPGAMVVAGGRRYEIEPRRLFVIPSGTVFDFSNDRPVGHLYIHFDVIGLSPEAQRALSAPMQLAQDARLESEAAAFEREPALVRLESHLRVLALVHAVLAEVVAERAREMPAGAGDSAVVPALVWIEEHLHEPLRNPTLARMCNLSEDYFIRRFRDATGVTPAEYIRQRRILVAAQRLVLTGDSIDRIATDLGFQNRFSFSRAFTAVMGVPPARHRREGRELL